jgi:hypothetical protein
MTLSTGISARARWILALAGCCYCVLHLLVFSVCQIPAVRVGIAATTALQWGVTLLFPIWAMPISFQVRKAK